MDSEKIGHFRGELAKPLILQVVVTGPGREDD